MKNLIVLVFSLLTTLVMGQEKFVYSQTQYNLHVSIDEPYTPRSVDGFLYTELLDSSKYEQWLERFPDGYEVICDTCKVKTKDFDAVEQVFISGSAVTSFVAPSWFRIDTIIPFDTIKVVMITTKEIYGQKLLVELNGYGVINGWSHIEYLDANKIPVKEVVWLSKEEEW